MIKIWKRMGKRSKVLTISLSFIAISLGLYSFNDTDFKIAKNLDIFVTLFREVNMLYVDGTDPEELIEASIEGMLESLDPYTTYIPEKNMDDFKFMTTGKYGGIGALIRKAGDYTMVSEPYEGFPAQRNDLHAGDTLLAINGASTKGKSISDVSEMLKGNPNTPLELQIKRIGVDSVITKKFNREQVQIANVPYYGIIEDKVGYIVLGNFMKNAAKEVKEAYEDLIAQGATSLILDLRSNPGGLLDEAVNIANIWVPKNQEIVNTKGKLKQWDKEYITRQTAVDTSMPMAVLVNSGSASASEIVAGSLQDLDRAVIIGQKTFGKGLVQTTRPLSYNSHLKITTAKYYIPSGRCIQARDYAHRNDDGSVGFIPDSLISEFKTRNGRKVYDGGGIKPDIKIENGKPGNITIALYAQNLIFDYATIYRSEHAEIADARSFEITDEIYADFTEFVSGKDFDYNTQSSDKLTDLIKTAKAEGYYDKIEEQLDMLKDQLHGDMEKDLDTFGKEIKDILKDEIVSRYYYQKGRILTSLSADPEVIKAVEVLNDSDMVTAILHGSYSGETIFAYYTH